MSEVPPCYEPRTDLSQLANTLNEEFILHYVKQAEIYPTQRRLLLDMLKSDHTEKPSLALNFHRNGRAAVEHLRKLLHPLFCCKDLHDDD